MIPPNQEAGDKIADDGNDEGCERRDVVWVAAADLGLTLYAERPDWRSNKRKVENDQEELEFL